MMLSAAILAGGQARRFGGRDKRALVVGGRPIVDRQVAELARISDDVFMVGGAPGASGLRHPLRIVPDRVHDAGPLAGLDAALAVARYDYVALIACDMPFVSGALLRHMAAVAANHRPHGEAAAAVPRTERGYHPLCAVYTRSCHPLVAEQLAAGHLRMVDMLARIAVREVADDELDRFGGGRRLLANVNTPADCDAAEALSILECHEI